MLPVSGEAKAESKFVRLLHSTLILFYTSCPLQTGYLLRKELMISTKSLHTVKDCLLLIRGLMTSSLPMTYLESTKKGRYELR